MTVHTVSPGEDLAAIRARLDLDDDAILHIGAAGAIHFDDAAEQDEYDDRVLVEAKAVRWKRNPQGYQNLVEANRRKAGPKHGAGRPKGSKNKKTKGEGPKKGGSE